MKLIYLAFPQFIAWTSFVTGMICLVMAIYGKKRTDLAFSLIGLILILFFIIPPEAFNVTDTSHHLPTVITKRLFALVYCVSIPWYLLQLSAANQKRIIVITFCGIAGGYLILYDVDKKLDILWMIVTVISVAGIAILGVRTIVWQYMQAPAGNKLRLFVAALSLYQLLFLSSTLIHLTKLFPATGATLLTAYTSVYSLIFALTVVGMLVALLVERSRLEKVSNINEKRLQSVMENAPMIVLELERDGRITYINDFGTKLLGYENSQEIRNLNWFNAFLLPSDIGLLKKLYSEIFCGHLETANFKNTIRCQNDHEIIISWVNFLTHEQPGRERRMIGFGRDVSSEEAANKLVAQMQKELEKENIGLREPAQLELEENIVGQSKAFTYAIQRARQVAMTHAPVLLEGETGVGKEVFANLIHKNSSRSKMPFIKVNCGALPKELIEDELFGHEKGAFTSAIQARKGRFELADNGTIFLDEIGELPYEMQPKLLRVLQNGEFERVGGQKTLKVDVRILAATNRNLLDEISHGSFREDLYYRLNVFPITIPALRNRKEDLPDLIQYFIATKCKEYNKVLEQISTADLQRLVDYRWPGNIRELKNVIERAVIVSEGRVLKLDWWSDNESAVDTTPIQTLERIERDHIMTTMEKCHWKINGENGAAEILNMHPNTLRSKMKRLGIVRPQQVKPLPELPQANNYFPKESTG